MSDVRLICPGHIFNGTMGDVNEMDEFSAKKNNSRVENWGVLCDKIQGFFKTFKSQDILSLNHVRIYCRRNSLHIQFIFI